MEAKGVGAHSTGTSLNTFITSSGLIFKVLIRKSSGAGVFSKMCIRDRSMWFETDKGLVILLGCCHSGIVNTVNYIRKVSGVEKVSGIVGGMHLIRANEERMKNTLEAMKSWNLDWLIPCHCTGDKAMQQMKDYLGDKVTFGCTGTVIEPVSYTHLDVYKRQEYRIIAVNSAFRKYCNPKTSVIGRTCYEVSHN